MDGAILSRKEKLICLGQSSREPNPAPTRLLRCETANWCFRGRQPRGQFTSGRRETRKRSPNAHAQLWGNTLRSVEGRG